MLCDGDGTACFRESKVFTLFSINPAQGHFHLLVSYNVSLWHFKVFIVETFIVTLAS